MESDAGEAASLFGAADSTAGLFSMEGDAGVSNPTTSGEPSHSQSNTASDLFSSASEGTDFFSTAGVSPLTSHQEYDLHAPWDGVAQSEAVDAAGGVVTSMATAYSTQQYTANGFYGDYGAVAQQGHPQTYTPSGMVLIFFPHVPLSRQC